MSQCRLSHQVIAEALKRTEITTVRVYQTAGALKPLIVSSLSSVEIGTVFRACLVIFRNRHQMLQLNQVGLTVPPHPIELLRRIMKSLVLVYQSTGKIVYPVLKTLGHLVLYINFFYQMMNNFRNVI
jgi:hypothetical protein